MGWSQRDGAVAYESTSVSWTSQFDECIAPLTLACVLGRAGVFRALLEASVCTVGVLSWPARASA